MIVLRQVRQAEKRAGLLLTMLVCNVRQHRSAALHLSYSYCFR